MVGRGRHGGGWRPVASGGHDGFRQGARRADLFLCFFVDFVVSPFFVVPSLWF